MWSLSWSLSWGVHMYPTYIGHSPVLEAQAPKFSMICQSAEKESINKGLPICVSGKIFIFQKLGPCTPCDILMYVSIKDSKLLLFKEMGHIFDAVSRFGLRFEHRFEHRFRKTRLWHLMGRGLQCNLQGWRKIGPPNQIPHSKMM